MNTHRTRRMTIAFTCLALTMAGLFAAPVAAAGPGLQGWDPGRWRRHKLAEPAGLACPQLVTAFGHGKHSCPAKPFSLAAMATAAMHIFGTCEVTPQWSTPPVPLLAQIGGVARAAGPTPVSYRRR